MKNFIQGFITMALIASVAFNFYQAGQLKTCVLMPNTIQPINLK